MKNYKNLIVTGILFFALAAPVGFIFDQDVLKKTGLLYGISPLPLPFINMGEALENFRFKIRYEEFENGFYKDKTDVLTHEMERMSNFPHKYILPFIQTTSYSYLIPIQIREFVICKYATFKQSEKIKLIIEYKNKNVVTEVTCPKAE